MIQTTPMWLLFVVEEGDILNCRVVTTNKETALDSLINVGQGDVTPAAWYKLIRFEADGVFCPGMVAHVVVHMEDSHIRIICIRDQYEMIDYQIRNNDDYWIDDIEII